MFRMWAKIISENHMCKDMTVEDSGSDTRTHKVFHALETVCHAWDLGVPIWLEMNVSDFKRHRKTRFGKDNFVESVDFDFLEIQMLEEDD